ncbi:hypothetical protein BJ322DRAFT_141439 [Thelephora terrestris]|uniref:Uncharacterized protein n=1 Tax=Thelephora terrestris TaxID=56493 RepID=A0A9P6L5M7_9AGAM|nr:hypothetical protein BJ322DRAFT_141439 [Thelephora terrestris]
MSFSRIPEFNFEDITILQNNSYCGDNFGLDGFDFMDPSNVAGPSQPYTGADVQGDLNSYPDFLSPSTAPISLNPGHGAYPNDGYASQFYQRTPVRSPYAATTPLVGTSPSPFLSPSPVPTLSYGSPSISPEPYGLPITPIRRALPQPQVFTNQDNLGFGFQSTAQSFTSPTANGLPTYDPPYGEMWPRYPQPDLYGLNTPSFDSFTGVTPPEIPLPVPIASSSGPRRTRHSARETRRHDPLRSVKKVDSDADGWNRALVRFRAHLDTLFTVQHGQPSGGLTPEMALARLTEFVKEDLKRSPLRNMKAGEGKRSRDMEIYLEGLLQAIRRADPAPIPVGDSDECGTTVAALSRLAGELEARLAPVNQQPALRQSVGAPEARGKASGKQTERRRKRNEVEKARRDQERHQVERISRLFRASEKVWSKKDALGLAIIFLLRGPGAFPVGFIQVRLVAAGL